MRILIFFILLCISPLIFSDNVRVGIPNFDPPFAVSDPVTGPRGADINLMNEVCKRLQWSCKYIPMHYNDLFPALQQNTIDLAIGSLVITDDRKTDFSFSLPYLVSKGSFLLLSTSEIKSVEELKGKPIGALTGRIYIDYLKENFIGQIQVVPYKDQDDLVLDLKSGKIAAIFLNHLSAAFLEKQHTDLVKVLPEEYNIGGGLGIAATFANKDKIDQINKVLLQIESDGTFIKLYNNTFDFISLLPTSVFLKNMAICCVLKNLNSIFALN